MFPKELFLPLQPSGSIPRCQQSPAGVHRCPAPALPGAPEFPVLLLRCFLLTCAPSASGHLHWHQTGQTGMDSASPGVDSPDSPGPSSPSLDGIHGTPTCAPDLPGLCLGVKLLISGAFPSFMASAWPRSNSSLGRGRRGGNLGYELGLPCSAGSEPRGFAHLGSGICSPAWD